MTSCRRIRVILTELLSGQHGILTENSNPLRNSFSRISKIKDDYSEKFAGISEKVQKKKILYRNFDIDSTGASNLRPKNIFVRPKLDSEFNEKSVF
jgi:hypothetical protein